MIPSGVRLPDARLATVGGRSFAFHELRGRKALVYGWGSWSPSRDALPLLQSFYKKHPLELVTVAFEVTGPAAAMKVLKPAGADHTILIDATCTLTRRWGVRRVPFAFLLDEEGTLRWAGEAVDERFLERVAAALKEPPIPGEPMAAEESKRLYSVEILLQACTNFLGRKRQADATDSLRKALELDPGNEIIRAQLASLERG